MKEIESKKRKVYVELITDQNGEPPYNNQRLGRVYESIDAFEHHKDEPWRGDCEWILKQDKIGIEELDFRTYTMILTEITTKEPYRLYITIKGKIIKQH
jgi:hypothetical protein